MLTGLSRKVTGDFEIGKHSPIRKGGVAIQMRPSPQRRDARFGSGLSGSASDKE